MGRKSPNRADYAHDHDHPNDHPNDQRHGHGHPYGRGRRWVSRFRHAVRPHTHDGAGRIDTALEAGGMRTLWISLAVLGATTAVQALVAVVSGSVALLGDA